MILVIPFAGPSDYLSELSARLIKLGGLAGHRLLVSAPSNELTPAQEFVALLRGHFVAADVVPVTTPGAPIVRLFRDGVMAGARVKPGPQEIPTAPVLWLEPGHLPCKADWADILQSAFFNTGGGMRILGEWVKRADMTVGNGNARHVIPGGWESVGPTVFPAQFINSCEMLHRINDASDPWRERLQFILGSLRAESPTLSKGPESVFGLFEAAEKDEPEPASEETPAPAPAEAKPVRRAAVRSLTPVESTP